MIDTPQIAHTTAQLAAVIHVTIPRSEITGAETTPAPALGRNLVAPFARIRPYGA